MPYNPSPQSLIYFNHSTVNSDMKTNQTIKLFHCEIYPSNIDAQEHASLKMLGLKQLREIFFYNQ
jgi:hypothetical protein